MARTKQTTLPDLGVDRWRFSRSPSNGPILAGNLVGAGDTGGGMGFRSSYTLRGRRQKHGRVCVPSYALRPLGLTCPRG